MIDTLTLRKDTWSCGPACPACDGGPRRTQTCPGWKTSLTPRRLGNDGCSSGCPCSPQSIANVHWCPQRKSSATGEQPGAWPRYGCCSPAGSAARCCAPSSWRFRWPGSACWRCCLSPWHPFPHATATPESASSLVDCAHLFVSGFSHLPANFQNLEVVATDANSGASALKLLVGLRGIAGTC